MKDNNKKLNKKEIIVMISGGFDPIHIDILDERGQKLGINLLSP